MNRAPARPWLRSVLVATLACGCGAAESGHDPATREPADPPGAVGFEAQVSGEVAGRIEGPGIIRFVAPQSSPAGERSGYHFVADNAGVRDLGVTLILPRGTQPGTYRLETSNPMDVGSSYGVRVDHSVGARTRSFQHATQGSITIERFSGSEAGNGEASGKGRFAFTVEDREGRSLAVEGRFDIGGS